VSHADIVFSTSVPPRALCLRAIWSTSVEIKKFTRLTGTSTLYVFPYLYTPKQILTTHQLFCQNLCQFGRFFLETKAVVYETMGFRFYIHTAPGPTNRRRVTGFFSKEKKSWDDNNLGCILVLPPYHRQGIGKTLIAFSYELSRREQKIGSPEKRKPHPPLPVPFLWLTGMQRSQISVCGGTSPTGPPPSPLM
jgi:GNAT superfamily N-acetyltransferase